MNIFFKVFSYLIAISNIFCYKIDSFSVWTETNGQLTSKTIYYNRLITHFASLAYDATVFVAFMNYLTLTTIVILNILIYIEFRRLLDAKRRLLMNRKAISIIEDGTQLNSVAPLQAESLVDEEREKEMLRRTLVMTLWVSVFFAVDRLVKSVYRSLLFFFGSSSIYTYYLSTLSYFIDMIVFSSFFFIYLRTNTMFRKKFKEITMKIVLFMNKIF